MYEVMIGMDYTPVGESTEKRVEIGDVINDMPEASVKACLERGWLKKIEKVKKSKVEEN